MEEDGPRYSAFRHGVERRETGWIKEKRVWVHNDLVGTNASEWFKVETTLRVSRNFRTYYEKRIGKSKSSLCVTNRARPLAWFCKNLKLVALLVLVLHTRLSISNTPSILNLSCFVFCGYISFIIYLDMVYI